MRPATSARDQRCATDRRESKSLDVFGDSDEPRRQLVVLWGEKAAAPASRSSAASASGKVPPPTSVGSGRLQASAGELGDLGEHAGELVVLGREDGGDAGLAELGGVGLGDDAAGDHRDVVTFGA
jgi:hypothetical protein